MSKRDRPSEKDQYRRQSNRNNRDSIDNIIRRNEQSRNGLSDAQTSIQSSPNQKRSNLIESDQPQSCDYRSPYQYHKKQPHPLLEQYHCNSPNKQKKNSYSSLKSLKKYQKDQKDQKIVKDLIENVQLIEFNSERHDYFSLKDLFIHIVGRYIKIVDQYYLEHKNYIGQQLLKDGLFHQMWGKVVLTYSGLNKNCFLNRYYTCYIQKIQKNHSNFQSKFNPIQSQSQNPGSTFSKYIQAISQQYNTTYTNKPLDIKLKKSCALLYQQVQKQMQKDQQFNNIQKTYFDKIYRNCIDYDLKNAQFQLEDKVQTIEKQTYQDKNQQILSSNIKQTAIKCEKQISDLALKYKRQRSPQTYRFRLFQQSQPNIRRHKAQIAVKFLQIPSYYQMIDLQIVQILQTLLSPTQQIVILKAYTCEFCPIQYKMKIQPKVKLLISAYKFLNLQQLIRLEGMYGKFDGMVVYHQGWDFVKFAKTWKKQIGTKLQAKIIQQKVQEKESVGGEMSNDKQQQQSY